MVSSAFFKRDLSVIQAGAIDDDFHLVGQAFHVALNDIISRTTFRKQGKSNWVTSRTCFAISRATMSIGRVGLR